VAYLVLARKYRSATFEEVVGQDHVAATLVNAIKSERIAHAFLFTGTRGVGKTTMARILAKALNCLSADAPTPKPCNQCDACEAISRGDDMDVVEIDGASNRGIDEIRELRSNAIFRPARCRYKIYYIDEVHMLTKEAFNALLKTLEEPPSHVKFIFATTEPQRVPATIVSRCQRFDFRNIPTSLIAEHLKSVSKAEKVKADKAALFRIARAAAGSMRDGLSLLDQLLAGDGTVGEDDVVRILGTPDEERTAELAAAIADGDPAGALEALEALLQSGTTLASAMAAIGEIFRHMMLAATCGADSQLIELPDSQRQAVAELAGKFTVPALVQAVGVCQTTLRNLRGVTSGRGLAEAALVRLAAAEKFVDVESLLARLEGQPAGPSRPAGGAAAARAPAARAEKKKPLARRPGAVAGDGAGERRRVAARSPAEAEPPRPPQADLTDPKWEQGYLTTHWPAVVAAVGQGERGHVAGLLSPAKVLAVEGETLRLGYSDAHEPLRRRCADRMNEQIVSSLGELFGRAVRCEYVSTGAPADRPAARQPMQTETLSSAARAEVVKDAAVQAVLDFFGGSLTDIRSNAPAAGGSADEGGAQT